MYAETGVFFPHFQNFSQVQQLEELCKSQKLIAPMTNLVQSSSICEYDMGGEGDLFKAPELIMEEPLMGNDPMTAAISMISCCEDVISSQGLKIADLELLQSEVYYEFKRDLFEKAAIETQLSEVFDGRFPSLELDDNLLPENKLLPDTPIHRSISSGCLKSMEWINGPAVKSSFLDFPGMDFSSVYGMRRSSSDGDIKTLGNDYVSLNHSPRERSSFSSNLTTEERREKISRYRNKRTKRNFGRKIKYACRKALADRQPRIRGRFAKTEESI